MTKTPYALGPLMINPPKSWHNQTKSVLLVTLRLRTPVYLTGPQDACHTCTFRVADTRENILTGHKAKYSKHRTRQKENLV